MSLSARELIDAKEATADLLEHLGLDAYMFEVEPCEGPWQVHIECAHTGGWQTVTLATDRSQLLASRSDGPARQALIQDWRRRLADCRRAAPGKAPD